MSYVCSETYCTLSTVRPSMVAAAASADYYNDDNLLIHILYNVTVITVTFIIVITFQYVARHFTPRTLWTKDTLHETPRT